MKNSIFLDKPAAYDKLLAKSEEIGFTMPSDLHIGSLLKTLISSKPKGAFLELGTGIGLSLSWMVAGLDTDSYLISIDNDEQLTDIVDAFFKDDSRVEIICQDGSAWLKNNADKQFDLIFADAWPGKYSELDEAIAMLKIGGFYVIDDMNPQPNWPDGHAEKATQLIEELENRKDLILTKMDWSTGVILAVRIT